MKKSKILILILLLGLVIRLWKINIPLLEFEPSRQIQTAEITKNLYLSRLDVLHPTVGYLGPINRTYLLEFPGFNAGVAVLYFLTGTTNEIVGRLFSVFGWLTSAILLELISKRFIGRKLSLISVFFYALSPISVFVSRSFQPDQWMMTLSLASIYYGLIWKDKNRWFLLILSALLASLSGLFKAPSLVFTTVPLGLLILAKKNKGSSLHAFIFGFVALAPTILWYSYAYFQNKTASLVSEGGFSLSNWFWPGLFLNYRYYSTVFGWLDTLVLLPIGIVLLAVGLAAGSKKHLFLYFWLLGIIMYFFIFNRHTMIHEYYNFPLLPIASIFIAIGLSVLNKVFIKHSRYITAFVFFLIALNSLPVIFQKAYNPIGRFGHVYETAQSVKSFTNSNDLIIGAMDSGPTVVYYSGRKGWGFDIEGNGNPKVGNTVLKPIDYLEYLRSQGAVVFAGADKNRFLNNKTFSSYIYKNYNTLVDDKNYVIFDLKSSRF